jgi:hypothetical protein
MYWYLALLVSIVAIITAGGWLGQRPMVGRSSGWRTSRARGLSGMRQGEHR